MRLLAHVREIIEIAEKAAWKAYKTVKLGAQPDSDDVSSGIDALTPYLVRYHEVIYRSARS